MIINAFELYISVIFDGESPHVLVLLPIDV